MAGALALVLIFVLLIYMSRSLWLNCASSFITAKDDVHPADVIVIESWEYPNELSIRTAVQLQSSGFGKSIFLTEYFSSGYSYITYMEASQDYHEKLDLYLKNEGIEPKDLKRIFIPKKRPVTWNSAHAVMKALASQGYHSMILVTHWHHSRRSCDVYSKVGEQENIKVLCKPVGCSVGQNNWWKSSAGLSTVFREIAERVYYLLFFGIIQG